LYLVCVLYSSHMIICWKSLHWHWTPDTGQWR